MKRLTTDNPQGNFEKLMNFAYTKHNRVHLSYADGKEDIDLCEYVSKLAKAKGFDFSPDFIMEDGLFDNYDDDFAVLYYLAVQAAELRSRLKLYEDKLENGTLIELPNVEIGQELFYIDRFTKTVESDIVSRLTWERTDLSIHTGIWSENNGFSEFFNNIGKTLFLTKEKAEEKLKELNDKCL